MTSAIENMWDDFTTATGVDSDYHAWAFGEDESRELADELAELIRIGRKRATTGLLAEFEQEGEPLPEAGAHIVVLDGYEEPVCVVRCTEVETKPFGDVDEDFAATEGEGDGSLGFWRRAHQEYFAATGWRIDDESLVVLTRFEKVWPIDL